MCVVTASRPLTFPCTDGIPRDSVTEGVAREEGGRAGEELRVFCFSSGGLRSFDEADQFSGKHPLVTAQGVKT